MVLDTTLFKFHLGESRYYPKVSLNYLRSGGYIGICKTTNSLIVQVVCNVSLTVRALARGKLVMR